MSDHARERRPHERNIDRDDTGPLTLPRPGGQNSAIPSHRRLPVPTKVAVRVGGRRRNPRRKWLMLGRWGDGAHFAHARVAAGDEDGALARLARARAQLVDEEGQCKGRDAHDVGNRNLGSGRKQCVESEGVGESGALQDEAR